MTQNLLPFRMLSSTDLSHLKDAIAPKIEAFNHSYAAIPLSLELAAVESAPLINLTPFGAEKTLLPAESNYLEVISTCLFGENITDANEISQNLFIQLLASLMYSDMKLQDHQSMQMHEWFYFGAPTIKVTLNSLCLYLHPQWVYQQLPKSSTLLPNLEPLNKLVETQNIDLDVVLKPEKLAINTFLPLQVGNVLKTNHAINTPILLRHNHQILTPVLLGQKTPYKSIQLEKIA